MRDRDFSEDERDARSRRSRELNLARFLPTGYHGPWWTETEVALLARLPDDEVARRTGRTPEAGWQKRPKLAGRKEDRSWPSILGIWTCVHTWWDGPAFPAPGGLRWVTALVGHLDVDFLYISCERVRTPALRPSPSPISIGTPRLRNGMVKALVVWPRRTASKDATAKTN